MAEKLYHCGRELKEGIERFWRTVKQEHVYLNPAVSVEELRQGIDGFMRFYNYKLSNPV